MADIVSIRKVLLLLLLLSPGVCGRKRLLRMACPVARIDAFGVGVVDATDIVLDNVLSLPLNASSAASIFSKVTCESAMACDSAETGCDDCGNAWSKGNE